MKVDLYDVEVHDAISMYHDIIAFVAHIGMFSKKALEMTYALVLTSGMDDDHPVFYKAILNHIETAMGEFTESPVGIPGEENGMNEAAETVEVSATPTPMLRGMIDRGDEMPPVKIGHCGQCAAMGEDGKCAQNNFLASLDIVCAGKTGGYGVIW